MGNSRVRNRFELALDGKQVIALVVGVAVLVAGVFVFGMNLGRRSVITAAAIVAPKDPLAHLDEPLPVPARDEAVELKAHQALTDARPIDKALPVPHVKATTVAITPPPAPAPLPVRTEPSVQTERRPAGPESKSAVADSKTPVRTERSAKAMESKVGVAKSTESKAAPAKKGAYTVQIASLATRADAERVAKKNNARKPRIVEADVPGKGRHYRVLVGSFESRDAAKRQLASLTRAGVQGIVTAVR